MYKLKNKRKNKQRGDKIFIKSERNEFRYLPYFR